ncbi:NUDIX domain-containing protein [Nocardia terpenica]|uniref:NUDIX hydrolase n=1 Tax=Nocardia terpenica TaxID=455432 RepID=A0A164KM49_9NOCA|nr:NUDIX domain-containing protein [Nocardia terpenica]KZM71533.1 NUDIX hydrolase [Nocardia terpenica]MBF6063161.1 NUDIX domain-containing protein [Nocardia terpenica]MBF6105717.1 NUDIX domain-containing protein [Nocardia terpenica]MBF6113699.1 NUDIX domain-containing protein [Nocardia terpenica]MBF6119458.1 NUDIX domain-containing protein [Nocardia terpenica]
MSAESLHDSARDLLENWSPAAHPERSLRQTMLAFLDSAPRGCLREHAPGHITASAVVFSHDEREVLLTLHPRVGLWIQLGGHCEEFDDTVVDAALREATEESGIPDLTIEPGLYGVQAHGITCSLGVPTRHLDLLFKVRAPENAVPVRSDESTDLRWWPVDALPDNAEVLLYA